MLSLPPADLGGGGRIDRITRLESPGNGILVRQWCPIIVSRQLNSVGLPEVLQAFQALGATRTMRSSDGEGPAARNSSRVKHGRGEGLP